MKNPLVLVFGSRFLLEKEEVIKNIRQEFPYEHIVFGSTAGEILCCNVYDGSIAVTVMEFERSSFIVKRENILDHFKNSKTVGGAAL